MSVAVAEPEDPSLEGVLSNPPPSQPCCSSTNQLWPGAVRRATHIPTHYPPLRYRTIDRALVLQTLGEQTSRSRRRLFSLPIWSTAIQNVPD